jgi:hypothetical protein
MARSRLPARTRIAAVIALGVAACATLPALAQTPEELARARQVFGEGKQLEGKGAWAEALEKFKDVAAVKMTPQVRYHIALCEENLGRLVSAMKGFELATEEAKVAGAAAIEVTNAAPAHSEALRARVAKLHVTVKGKVIGSKIVLDDVTLPASAIGADVPVDPGSHVIEVRDESGKSTFRKEVTLAEKGSETVEVPVSDGEVAKPPPTATAEPVAPPSRAPAFAVGAVGIASLAASGIFLGLRQNTIAEIEMTCRPGTIKGCSKSLEATADQGRLYQTLAGVFLGVGVAGLGTAGALWFVLAPKKPAPPPPAKASVQVLPMGPGLQVVGTF